MKTATENSVRVTRHLMIYGLIFAGLFAAAHGAGWRESTTIISATLPTADANWNHTALRAGAYLILYFSALILTPTCLAAAALDWAWHKCEVRSAKRTLEPNLG